MNQNTTIRSGIALIALFALVALAALYWWPRNATLRFVGTQYDLGGKAFPKYDKPQASIVPWRSNAVDNQFDPADDGDDYFGTAGYALFATQFSFPNANPPDQGDSKLSGESSNYNVGGSKRFPNIVAIPSFIAEWRVLSPRMLGGWSYAIVDDPRTQHGPRLWTFDGINYPLPSGGNVTGIVPYLKLGVLDGQFLGPDDPVRNKPSDRWLFTIGDDPPPSFRVGVITDGLDGIAMAPGKLTLRQTGGESVSTPTLERNRFVDLHFFDVLNARTGQEFIISAEAATDGVGAGVSGFCFDVNPFH